MTPAGPATEPSASAPPFAAAAPSTMRRDLLSAYAASGAKVAIWVLISAMVFRESVMQFALLALVRATIGLLNYTTLGLAPAMIRLLAESAAAETPRPRPVTSVDGAPGVLPYAGHDPARLAVRRVYANGGAVALIAGALGVALTLVYAANFHRLHEVPIQVGSTAATVAGFFGVGAVLRLMSEAPGAVVQTSGSIARDNYLVAWSEAAWLVLTGALIMARSPNVLIVTVAAAYAAAGALLLAIRSLEAGKRTGLLVPDLRLVEGATVKRLLTLGVLIAVGQLADFLYAPTDYILINRLISPGTVAWYAPAVQIDGGLLLLVGALSAVLLPKAAVAHVAGDIATLRRYYVRGTLAAAVLLALAAPAVYGLSPWIFRAWLGDPLPQTQAILPLVLVHTVLGGSSGVGRSILLAMGKAKPFAVAMLVAGAGNVLLSYCLVKYGGLGLKGIVYGTIATAVGRCVVWQPWYVMRTLRSSAGAPPAATDPTLVAAAEARAREPL